MSTRDEDGVWVSRAWLEEVAEGRGPYKRDPFEHAKSVIEYHMDKARAALTERSDGDGVWVSRELANTVLYEMGELCACLPNEVGLECAYCEFRAALQSAPKEERIRRCKHWEPGQTSCKLHNLQCAAPDCFIYVSAAKEES